LSTTTAGGGRAVTSPSVVPTTTGLPRPLGARHITSVNLGARRTITVDVLFAHPKLLASSLPGFDDAFVDAVLGRDETMLIGGSEDDPEDADDPPARAAIVTARDDSRAPRRRGLLARRATSRRASRSVAPQRHRM
jgi:hypothetical protein